MTVQVRGDRFTARARTATADEKPELWQEMIRRFAGYEDYQRKANREIPVVVLERQRSNGGSGFLDAPERIRTSDLRFRRPTLYPAELRARGRVVRTRRFASVPVAL